MLILSNSNIKDKDEWKRAGIDLPGFDIEQAAQRTAEHPTWLHFGAGNILKGYISVLQQTLLNQNNADTGIIAVETYDLEIIDRIYTPYDNLNLLVLMKPTATPNTYYPFPASAEAFAPAVTSGV